MKKEFIKDSALSLSSGILIALMITANGLAASIFGNWISLVVINLIGLLTAGIVLAIKRSTSNLTKGVPFVYLIGGAIGVITVLFNNICVNNIGVAMTMGLALVGQIITSAVTEHFGVLGMVKKKITLQKTPAYFLMVTGAVIMIVWG